MGGRRRPRACLGHDELRVRPHPAGLSHHADHFKLQADDLDNWWLHLLVRLLQAPWLLPRHPRKHPRPRQQSLYSRTPNINRLTGVGKICCVREQRRERQVRSSKHRSLIVCRISLAQPTNSIEWGALALPTFLVLGIHLRILRWFAARAEPATKDKGARGVLKVEVIPQKLPPTE